MSQTTETTNTETTKAVKGVKTAPKKTVKAVAPKATEAKTTKAPAKKTEPKEATSKGEHGMTRSHDVKWNDKKVAIFKALKQLKCVDKDHYAAAAEVVGQTGDAVNSMDVRHYCYHAAAAGLVKVIEVEGTRGYVFHLTAKGAALDPVAELKKQNAAKEAK